MNKDLSSQEWCNHIRIMSNTLSGKAIKPHTIAIEDILNLVTNNFSFFLKTIEIIPALYKAAPQSITENVIDYFHQMKIVITTEDVSYIASLFISLNTNILPKNSIKILECSETYERMEKQASTITSVFNIGNFPPKYNPALNPPPQALFL